LHEMVVEGSRHIGSTKEMGNTTVGLQKSGFWEALYMPWATNQPRCLSFEAQIIPVLAGWLSHGSARVEQWRIPTETWGLEAPKL